MLTDEGVELLDHLAELRRFALREAALGSGSVQQLICEGEGVDKKQHAHDDHGNRATKKEARKHFFFFLNDFFFYEKGTLFFFNLLTEKNT